MAVSYIRPTTVHLIPSSCKIRKHKTRYYCLRVGNFVPVVPVGHEDRRFDGRLKKDIYQTITFLNQRFSDHRCEAYPTCTYCGDDGGKSPSCRITFHTDGKYPRVSIHLRTCYPYGSILNEEIIIYECSGRTDNLVSAILSTNNDRFEFQNIPSSVASHLGTGLHNHTSLKILTLTDMQITRETALMISEVLEGSLTLEQLDLAKSRFEIDDRRSIMALANGFRKSSNLRVLSFQDCRLPDVVVAEFAIGLAALLSLEQLNLRGNNCGAEALREIGNILRAERCSLCTLDLTDACDYEVDFDISPVAKALTRNTSLTELILVDNKMAEHGVECLAEALGKNETLKTLQMNRQYNRSRVDHSCLTPTGIGFLAAGFSAMQGLATLDISNNKISTESLAALADELRKNTSLQHLRATHLKADDTGMSSLLGALEENSTLLSLDLSCNAVGFYSLSRLALALRVNSTLENLRLNSCSITDDGIGLFAGHLSGMKRIENLSLNFNSFGISGAKALLEGLKGNFSLLSLKIANGCWGVCGSPLNYTHEEYPDEYSEIGFYLKLNRGGRRLLSSAPFLPSLWPLVLEKAQNDKDVIYCLLREEVLLSSQ